MNKIKPKCPVEECKDGIFLFECGCMEWCCTCSHEKFNQQPIKHWSGGWCDNFCDATGEHGWHPLNGPYPGSDMDIVITGTDPAILWDFSWKELKAT